MGPWSVNPAWQNFSSLYREALIATEAPTEFDTAHHLTASLYFGISALEAFLNKEVRDHLSSSRSEQQIFKLLRNGRFLAKLDDWPKELFGIDLPLESEALEILHLANEVRGDLTHPKAQGHDIYERLFQINPIAVVEAVAQYIVAFNQGRGTRYPYWIFGWNYLNPRMDACDIILLNDQQFCHSLAAIGFQIPSFDWGHSEEWRNRYLCTIDGYSAIRDALIKANRCEPKSDRFPFQPKLCCRWWEPKHQMSCGNVSPESLAAARRLDEG